MKQFIPNVNGVKLKSYKKRKPEPNWEQRIVDKAEICKHNRNIDPIYGEVYCSKCFAIYDYWYVKDPEDKGSNTMIVWNRKYDKTRWTTYSLEYMQGSKNDDLTAQLWLELIRDVPDPFRWYDVYKAFQKNQLLKYWIAFGSFIGMKIKLNRTIMDYFNKYMEIGHGKYSISYFYLLYKFTQLFGEEGDEQYIPLKNSAAWCKKTDIWWKEICEKEGWKFIQTKVYKINWDKEQFLKKYALSVKRYIADALTYS